MAVAKDNLKAKNNSKKAIEKKMLNSQTKIAQKAKKKLKISFILYFNRSLVRRLYGTFNA